MEAFSFLQPSPFSIHFTGKFPAACALDQNLQRYNYLIPRAIFLLSKRRISPNIFTIVKIRVNSFKYKSQTKQNPITGFPSCLAQILTQISSSCSSYHNSLQNSRASGRISRIVFFYINHTSGFVVEIAQAPELKAAMMSSLSLIKPPAITGI